MYCVKCGVELADSEDKCPLCGTHVAYPDFQPKPEEKPFPSLPAAQKETVSRSGALFMLSVSLMIPLLVSILCDLQLTGGITFSGYSSGALILLYIIAVLPVWFRRPNPVIFVPVDFAAAALYLFYINAAVSGNWFFTFALPVTGAAALIATAVVALIRYVRRGYLYIFGGMLIASGAFCVLTEFLLRVTFSFSHRFYWSVYPLVACFLSGMALIVIAICKPLRQSLHKKFFI